MRYHCVECRCQLNTSTDVVLVGESGNQRGLFFFDTRLGNYSYQTVGDLVIEPGSSWEFRCPVCQVNLTTPISDRLANLRLSDGEEEQMVVFSKVASEHATFVVRKEEIEIYGSDSEQYIELSIQKHYW